jgi:hypothetical protein
MKKSKGETIDLTYSGPNKKKEKKVNSKKSKEGKSKKNDSRIDLNNEIIIGLTPKKEAKKKKTSKKETKRKPAKKPASKKSSNVKKKTKKAVSEQVLNKRKAQLKIFKWVSLTVLIAACIILFMLSSVFNISEIRVARK